VCVCVCVCVCVVPRVWVLDNNSVKLAAQYFEDVLATLWCAAQFFTRADFFLLVGDSSKRLSKSLSSVWSKGVSEPEPEKLPLQRQP